MYITDKFHQVNFIFFCFEVHSTVDKVNVFDLYFYILPTDDLQFIPSQSST